MVYNIAIRYNVRLLALNGSALIKYTQMLMAVYTANTPLFTKHKWHYIVKGDRMTDIQ